MGHAIAPLEPVSVVERTPPKSQRKPPEFRFHNLVLSEPRSLWRGRSATLLVSILLHSALLVAVIIVPLMVYDYLPAPGEVTRAFFVAPPDVAPPPPPPPPPPPAGVRAVTRAPVAPRPVEPASFVAPIEVPDVVAPEMTIDIGGVDGGVPGGVEGGVPGGVVGGIVGGLPSDAPPPPARVVRIGGQLIAPKLVHKGAPDYPELARQARLQAVIILEAWVGTDGRVKGVKVLRGAPLFDDPAMAAVKQWRYKPLLLNGQPTEFILTVTITFKLEGVE